MASPGNQHCANCIGTLSFPMAARLLPVFACRSFDVCNFARTKHLGLQRLSRLCCSGKSGTADYVGGTSLI